MDTVTVYRKQLFQKYQADKGGDLSVYLVHPTEALIREACILLYRQSTDEMDKKTLQFYFKYTEQAEEQAILKSIRNGKFRSIEKFLKEGTNTTEVPRLDMIALLLDFKHRPYTVFRKNFEISMQEGLQQNEANTPIQKSVSNSKDEVENGTRAIKMKSLTTPRFFALGFLVVGGIWLGTMFASDATVLKTEKEISKCMTWQENRYVSSPCNEGQQSLTYDQKLVDDFRMVVLDSTMTLFDNGKPLYWYHKHQGEVTFFTSGGKHPITGKRLRPISERIIRKEIYGEN
ncbi:MAG: hypothetical protein OIF50_15430 [Flavobacteriaceae bacterium]|nr:hypothetical protein [Flavobacteriaceae bacterium]